MPEKKKPKTEKTPEKEEGLDGIKNTASGVFVLVVVCSILWLISYFGPKGTDWLRAQSQAFSGIETPEPEPETAGEEEKETAVKPEPVPEKVTEKTANPASPTVVPRLPEEPLTPIENARRQIQEALGGEKKAIVRYVAISEDEQAMVAAVLFPESENPSKIVEIRFTRDEFKRYQSVEDSPIEQKITVWSQ